MLIEIHLCPWTLFERVHKWGEERVRRKQTPHGAGCGARAHDPEDHDLSHLGAPLSLDFEFPLNSLALCSSPDRVKTSQSGFLKSALLTHCHLKPLIKVCAQRRQYRVG